MVKCAVPTCKNDSRRQTRKNNDISFHRFPKDRELASKWVAAIKRENWEPNIRSFVCSIHFSPSSTFETNAGRRKLAMDAVPELKIKKEANDDTVLPSTSKTVVPKIEYLEALSTDSDTPNERKLKSQIMNLRETARRRRLRCICLINQNSRLKKKIEYLQKMLAHVVQNKPEQIKTD